MIGNTANRVLLVTFVTLCGLVNFLMMMGWLQSSGEISNPFKSKRIPTTQVVIPPYLLAPPQASNGHASFEEQSLRYCLSAYEASPFNKEASDDAVYMKQKLRDRFAPPPRILHFIFIGDVEDQYIRFTFTDFIMIRAAYFRLQPDEIYLHSNVPPLDSPLWDLIQPMISARKELVAITEIYGNKVTGKAHFSDVARLRVLQEYGGMYMDIDSICLKPFSKSMWDPPSGLTMGWESQKRNHIGCGVIIARKDSMYLTRWLELYKTFNDEEWADHTVVMAGKLAKEFPDEIDVLPETHFYRPSWEPEDRMLLWDEQPGDEINMFNFSKAYAPHYWGTFARGAGKIERMTPQTILTENVGIHQILRPLLPNPYFSIVLHCKDNSQQEYWKMQNSIDSILNQTFPLWEIMLVDESPQAACSHYVMNDLVTQLPRLKNHLPKSIRKVQFVRDQRMKGFTKGVWLIDLGAGREFSHSGVLTSALNGFRDDSDKRVWQIDGEKRVQFVYDPRKGVSHIPRPFVSTE